MRSYESYRYSLVVVDQFFQSVDAFPFFPPLLQTLNTARQFELASSTETKMTSDANVHLFDFHPPLSRSVTAAWLRGNVDTEREGGRGGAGGYLRQGLGTAHEGSG